MFERLYIVFVLIQQQQQFDYVLIAISILSPIYTKQARLICDAYLRLIQVYCFLMLHCLDRS